MASKGPRSKLDHDTRARRQKAIEGSKEPPRPKTHWDHVLEEMVWLSKDFESERKWKLAQAKKVAIRASKSILDHATRGEKKMKEEEQRVRKIALNISKDMKKFWMKIEKLVLYKHQLELEERKKKTLDKQLDFLLGQTERYSTMLAENLVDMPFPHKTTCIESAIEQQNDANGEAEERGHDGSTEQPEPQCNNAETDGDYGIQSEDESEDDEHTIEEDEALITEEERKEELEALQDEMDLPIEELLKRYKVSREGSPESSEDMAEPVQKANTKIKGKKGSGGMEILNRTQTKLSERELATSDSSGDLSDSLKQANGSLMSMLLENLSDADSVPACKANHPVGRKNERTKVSPDSKHHGESNGAISKLEDQMPIANMFRSELRSKGRKTSDVEYLPLDSGDELDDKDYVLGTGEDKDDETTLSEEEELTKEEANDPIDEIKLLQQESEVPVEVLLERYKKDVYTDEENQMESDSASVSSDDQMDCSSDENIKIKNRMVSMDDYVVEQDVLDKYKEVDPITGETEVELKNESEGNESENIIADAAAAARSAQPTGNTFSTTKVRTKFPFLLKHPLREYQHIGLDWLVTMYEKRLNGILADEMGLGKTIMTIALLAHLACEKGIWGPHLIVVPTSVMLNWETEFLKWCPAFKILTYFGSAKERKFKRQGWLKPNSFHVCITTYRLVIQDAKVFKRKKWKYLILDEAHLIKNWKSQRWQTLLNFNSKRRILLTGTPLQNDLMELWSLMHFLMPHIFQSHQEFKDWFSNPISGMVEGQEKVNKEVVDRLHNVLRPFILRRLKRDVEKQLPKKYEHVICCRLSKRQRNLYEDFIASSETQATLASANFFGMISVIMQLRKVCNHPDLFEGRPIISSFDMAGIDLQLSSSICTILSSGPFSKVDLTGLSLLFTHLDFSMTSWEIDELTSIATPSSLIEEASCIETLDKVGTSHRAHEHRERTHGINIFEEIQKALWEERVKEARERMASVAWWNSLQCRKKPVYGANLRKLVTIMHPVFDIHQQKRNPLCYMDFSSKLADIILLPVERFQMMLHSIESFMFAIPAARAPPPVCWCSKTGSPVLLHPAYKEKCIEMFAPLLSPIRPAVVRRQVYFPDRRLIQFDCGKLQELAVLLRRLKSEGHRALIFTQMTKMLDILEAFINLYGYTYMRLDGSTQPEERQTLMQRFNTNPKFFLFILSTRSGGVGINLVGADTVIFYDSDWNPAMDQQAQDRCHRIGQTREVHIYRLISESTIEENIIKKANQKRALDDLVIQSGSYNTEFFKKLDPMELFSGHRTLPIENLQKGSSTVNENSDSGMEVLLSNDDMEAALKQAEDEADYMALKRVEQEEAVENQEFTEEAIGRLEDDEFGNEDDMKPDEKITEEYTASAIICKDTDASLNGGTMNEERALTLVAREEDADMLADVKQMAAAAAAAGQASSSFENQLRPIDRYAMRFLDLWDPIIDKSAIESQVTFEEAEWELDRIEKFKEDLEAEIDEDEEPLLYERWDADFATEAYRQQVEALAHRQLMEELESKAKETEDADDERDDPVRNEVTIEHKPKFKKKVKKTKFKSLKKGALASESEALHKKPPVEPMSVDDKVFFSDVPSPDTVPPSPIPKKRKRPQVAPEEENVSKKRSKKLKKAQERSPVIGSITSDKQNAAVKEGMIDLDVKPANRSKMGGKVSITFMPLKRVLVIKPEKLKRRGNVWSKDCFPSPDSWSPQEDAILCAIIHEYSTHWSLVSDTLYGMTAGGFFRGRFRHPAHCCERFRELFSKYVFSTTDHPNNEKINFAGSGKALLKVTEDHVRTLLDVASELPDNELLLQKHFTALLSSVWRMKNRFNRRQSMPSSRNSLHFRSFFSATSLMQGKSRSEPYKMNFSALGQNCKLVAAALNDANRKRQEEPQHQSNVQELPSMAEKLDITLEFCDDRSKFETPFPPFIDLSICGLDTDQNKICGLDPLPSEDEPLRGRALPDSSRNVAENRFRIASKACVEGESLSWASSAFPTCDVRTRPCSKSQSLGKHKATPDSIKPPKSKLARITEANDECSIIGKPTLPSPVTASTNPIVRVDLPHFREDPEINEDRPCSPVDDLLPEMESYESISHIYDPGFIMGLDDCKSLPKEITDIG